MKRERAIPLLFIGCCGLTVIGVAFCMLGIFTIGNSSMQVAATIGVGIAFGALVVLGIILVTTIAVDLYQE